MLLKFASGFGRYLIGDVSDEKRFKNIPQWVKSDTEEMAGYYGIAIILIAALIGFSLGAAF